MSLRIVIIDWRFFHVSYTSRVHYDRRRKYDAKVGEREVQRQQSLSKSRYFVREFADDDSMCELLELYYERHGESSALCEKLRKGGILFGT